MAPKALVLYVLDFSSVQFSSVQMSSVTSFMSHTSLIIQDYDGCAHA